MYSKKIRCSLSSKEYSFWSKLWPSESVRLKYLVEVTFCYCFIKFQVYVLLLLDIYIIKKQQLWIMSSTSIIEYTDISSTGNFPDWHFSEDRSPTDTSPTDISPMDISPNGQFLDWTLPRQRLPRPNFSSLRCFPDRTFPRPGIFVTICFSEIFFKKILFQILFCLFVLVFTKLWYKAVT